MVYILINIVPIALSALAGLLLGYLWTKTFGTSAERVPTFGFALAVFSAEFWLASILAGALILAPREAGEWTMAIGSAVVIWVGFVLPALAVTLGFRRVAARAIVADCAHWLILMLIQAVVLKSYGLVPPPGAPTP